MNGTLVERTKLPSFTITLGTYYVLWGAKLGFSKLIVDQVQVGDIRDSSGHTFWVKIFASTVESQRPRVGRSRQGLLRRLDAGDRAHRGRHGRDAVHTSLRPKAGQASRCFWSAWPGWSPESPCLHNTDGVSGNWLGAAVIAASAVVGLFGYGHWRFEPHRRAWHASAPSSRVIRLTAAGPRRAWRSRSSSPGR